MHRLAGQAGGHELPLRGLHHLLAQDGGLGLAVLRGLWDWGHGRVCLEVWVASKQCSKGQGMGKDGRVGVHREVG